ncbi:nitric oxide synthase oxygenase [Alkalicoccus daliensis]
MKQAEEFITLCYSEWGRTKDETALRLYEINKEINETAMYTHTVEELTYGAKLAWRNANKCIGRLFWETLTVFDERNTADPAQVAIAAKRHLEFAENEGKIRSTITIFPPRTPEGKDPVRFLNHQLIRYAGYKDGRGDPASIHMTHHALQQGWKAAGGDFDILPLLIEDAEEKVHLFELKNMTAIREIRLRHPEEAGFEKLGLQWYAVPVISDMELEIGGIIYPAAPFNGWYMGTEIGARNLADDFRYNKLREVAVCLGLDVSKATSLWKDRALVELNRAVIYSFQEEGVSLVDHHTAAEQFRIFCEREERKGREITGDWTWLIPPVSPAATHIFHQEYDAEEKSPCFRYRDSPGITSCPFSNKK